MLLVKKLITCIYIVLNNKYKSEKHIKNIYEKRIKNINEKHKIENLHSLSFKFRIEFAEKKNLIGK